MRWWDPSEGNYLDQNASLSAFIRPMLPQAMLKCTNGVVHLQAVLTPLAQCHAFANLSLLHSSFTFLPRSLNHQQIFFFLPMYAPVWEEQCWNVKCPYFLSSGNSSKHTTCIENQRRNLSSLTKHRPWMFRSIHISLARSLTQDLNSNPTDINNFSIHNPPISQ